MVTYPIHIKRDHYGGRDTKKPGKKTLTEIALPLSSRNISTNGCLSRKHLFRYTISQTLRARRAIQST